MNVIKITMCSGKVLKFSTSHKNLEKWLEFNFKGKDVWYRPDLKEALLIRFENMETLEFIKENEEGDLK